ncbi:tail fiber domain-containing protein [Enterobacter roggenkampii]|uniref:tail fiber/spike domain-containing protein n=1 Tax=Enterobacter roggenkampii TaxID=1812935 RepID=UPI002019F891|nr:tail fiber domain-containing protein [Enterobacter roggenkampii]UQQ51958.1 tail fiber domain-containing protein [Enterobacter roggenkampii]
MTQYGTLNPLGSTSPYDLFDNAQNFDFAINDITNAIWQDRFGRNRQTWYGLEQLAKAAIAAFGYITLDSFQAGATLTLPNQVLRDTSTGEYYRWDGAFPKTVPAGSTPANTGGISLGAWLSVGDASLRAALKSESDNEGDALITVRQPVQGAIPITQHQHNMLIISPVHFGLIGDGTYHPLSEKFTTLAQAQAQYPNVTDLSLTDSIDYAAIQQADYAATSIGMTLTFPACHAVITKTILKKANWAGAGPLDSWRREAPDDNIVFNGRGTLLTPYGAGNGSRWTDETGTDSSSYTPFIVQSRSELAIYDMTLYCYASNRWNAGIFCPGVRRQTFVRCNVLGWWADAGIRVDATWSALNNTLTSLHPEVETDLGCNEYLFENCFITGLRGIRVQGTTRASTTTPFIWAPGGTSDHNHYGCRLGTEGPVDEKLANGAGYWHDAVIPNTAGAGQSINFTDTSIRVSAKYAMYLDHSNMVRMSHTYAETISSWVSMYGAAINACTSNTGAVIMWPDANGQRWYKNGTIVTDNSLVNWRDCRNLVKMRDDGFFSTPNFHASASSSDALTITSFNNTGMITLCRDDGTSQLPMWHIGDGVIRPNTDGGGSLGTSSYHLNNVYTKALLVKQNMRPLDANTVNNGTATFPWSGGYTQTAFTVTSDERYKTRPLDLTDAMLDACEEVDLIQFQYIDRIEVKGEDKARWHFGVIAQRVQEAFIRHGLDPHDYAFFCYDPEGVIPPEYETVQAVTRIVPAEYDEDGNRISDEREEVVEPAYEKVVRESYIIGEKYGIRYEEFLVLRAATIERKNKRMEEALAAITARLEKLENAG